MRGPMDCDDCLHVLYEYLDRALTEDDVRTVRTHLARCEECTDHFYFEERFLQKVREACLDDVAPPHLRESITLRLRSE